MFKWKAHEKDAQNVVMDNDNLSGDYHTEQYSPFCKLCQRNRTQISPVHSHTCLVRSNIYTYSNH